VQRIRPSAAEVAANPRARSAVLRVAERTEVPFEAGALPQAAGRGARAAQLGGRGR
jgi:16S rRNA (cytosine1402-N4)-methyltransferase